MLSGFDTSSGQQDPDDMHSIHSQQACKRKAVRTQKGNGSPKSKKSKQAATKKSKEGKKGKNCRWTDEEDKIMIDRLMEAEREGSSSEGG